MINKEHPGQFVRVCIEFEVHVYAVSLTLLSFDITIFSQFYFWFSL